MPSRSSWGVARLIVAVAALALVASATSAAQTGPPAPNSVATAIAYLQANPGSVGVPAVNPADVAVTSAYQSTHNGLTHVNVQQQFEGLPVGGAHATVNVASDGSVVFVGGNFEADPGEDDDAAVRLDAVEAVEAAAGALDLAKPTHLRVLELSVGGGQEALLSSGGISEQAIPARLV